MNTIAYSPYRIEVLLHHHTSPDDCRLAGTDLYRETVDEFVELGVLEHNPKGPHMGRLRTTDLGKAWVHALCNVPVPKCVFQDWAGNIIDLGP